MPVLQYHGDVYESMSLLFIPLTVCLICSRPPMSMVIMDVRVCLLLKVTKSLHVYILHRDPSIKRMICKSCDSLLVAGVTYTQRLRCKLFKFVG